MAFIPAVNHAFTVALGQEHVFHDRVNHFYRFNDHQFKKRFHIRKETAEDLMILLIPELYRPTKCSPALEESLQLCVALCFLADGCSRHCAYLRSQCSQNCEKSCTWIELNSSYQVSLPQSRRVGMHKR